MGAGINEEFIRRHGIFGKSRFRTYNVSPPQLRYGSRRSGKLVRVYSKPAISSFRVELELHSRLLPLGRIDSANALVAALESVVPKHCQIVELDWSQLRRHLYSRFNPDGRAIFNHAKSRARSIHDVLAYLRRKSVNNVHRFLRPMPENEVIAQAIAAWADSFPQTINI